MEHLANAIKINYNVSCDWEGSLYFGVTLKWGYDSHTVDLFIPGYIAYSIHQFQQATPPLLEHAPYKWMRTNYVSNQQLTPPLDLYKPLDPVGIKNIR